MSRKDLVLVCEEVADLKVIAIGALMAVRMVPHVTSQTFLSSGLTLTTTS